MGFKIRILVGLAWVGMGLASLAVAQSPLPSHGPSKGFLVITGGPPDYPRMIALAGGRAARIVVIPTAAFPSRETRTGFCRTARRASPE
jgi:hypothetical protein